MIVGVIVVLLLIGGFFVFAKKGGTPTVETTSGMPVPEVSTTPETMVVPGEVTVEIKDFKYNPAALTVKKGTVVTFINRDLAGHSATADDGSFDTGVLGQEKSKTVTFDKAGTFNFHCIPHPNIKGTITVE